MVDSGVKWWQVDGSGDRWLVGVGWCWLVVVAGGGRWSRAVGGGW